MILLHCRENSPDWHRRFRNAFTHGFTSEGYEVAWTPKDELWDKGITARVIFGPNYFPKADQATDCPTLKVDRCIIGDSHNWVTLGWNGWGGRGVYPMPRESDKDERMARVKQYLPKRKIDDLQWKQHHVIIGEYPSACDDHAAINKFYRHSYEMANDMTSRYGAPIYFRPHPNFNRCPDERLIVSKDDEILRTAREIHTYKSSFGVKCFLEGLPVSASPDSLARRAKGFLTFDAWLRWFVFTQWYVDEIASGEAIRHLMEVIDEH